MAMFLCTINCPLNIVFFISYVNDSIYQKKVSFILKEIAGMWLFIKKWFLCREKNRDDEGAPTH